MALEENGNMVMPVAPANSGSGFGFGGDWAWIILLLVLCGGGFGFGGGFGGEGLYPWLNNSQNINGGFRDQMLNTGISSIGDKITAGFGDVATQLCGGFAGVNATINNAQMANMQQQFALQTQLSQCCCDNRAGLADLRYTVATEACADRSAVNDALRDVLAANTASTQRILDQLCQDKIDAKNDTIAQLRSQINELSRTASQNAQTAAILANNEAQTAALEQYLAPVPRPAYIVQNPNCCTSGCGCGM